MRFVTVALLLLLASVQAGLWLGDGGLPTVMRLRAQLDGQLQANAAQRLANQRLSAEVDDLRQGLEMVEERARADLGMVKPDEILVQYAPGR
ncbi:MAG: septum formation initiator family protein [Aquabacterium sp.]|nr:septum formation initiator family protein [Aquabacterium sp.]OGA99816.1 MAG: septation ring formation regulator EzrA [Burkholderiales bacterium RIFCSPHIGHO2_12_FULL_69_20]